MARYTVFNSFMELSEDSKEVAILKARLNACAVRNNVTGDIIIDCRTDESESDERG